MWALIDQLVCQGVTDFFFAPGSRSTPLVIAAAAHPKVRLHSHFDERGLGFYALGMALAKEAPVAVIVTSGSAVGNLLPAVMEAHHASVPLILITADRPSELKECSANQTTDQSRLFQNFVRWQFEFEPSMPESGLRSQAAQAVFQASCFRPGPVHLNCPLREPLYPLSATRSQGKMIRFQQAVTGALSPQQVPSRGVILLGRLPRRSDVAQVLQLAQRLQWPVFADILSGARSEMSEVEIRHFDFLLKMPDTPKPEAILHFGERLTSKRVMEWLRHSPPNFYAHISPYSDWNDPSQLVTTRIVASVSAACAAIHGIPDANWLNEWKKLDREIALRLETAFDPEWTESRAMRFLSQHVPQALFLGNSMPIREANWFLFPECKTECFCNRGLSGIDGNLATAVGVAEGLQKPLVAVLGDLTTLHDLNSFSLLAKSSQPIKLIVSNNEGGGIFSHLPVAADSRFDELFAFKHTLRFHHAAQMFSIPYKAVETEAALAEALKQKGSCLIELFTCREKNARFHKNLSLGLVAQLIST